MSSTVFAGDDLVLEGQKWEAKANGYTCNAFTEQSKAPTKHEQFNVQFDVLRTDRTLDNALILAKFTEEDSICRYSAILLADNDASTIKLVDSHSYASTGSSLCLQGKNVLDESLASNEYLYWGHPHHATIMMPADSASKICGEDATHVGLDFIVSRKITNK